ncbi:hypothetical protein U1Q18_024768 [Sarracenia purpurea var. burkii]
MAAEEQILNLFDSYWFHSKILSPKPPLSTPEPNAALEIHEQLDQEPNLSPIIMPTLDVRSLSDHCLSYDSFSPTSILPTPKLQKILSGKEAGKFSEPTVEAPEKKKTGGRRRRRRKKKGWINGCKSLSELEFEELKGFMDLGFLFCEEDKNSSLGSIIPGLQRLGRKGEIGINDDGDDEEGKEEGEEEEVMGVGESAISRPYLSEAWGILETPLMNWTVPEVGNEMNMKDHLRIWAHAVASTVR